MDQINNYKIIGEPLKGGMGQVFHLQYDWWNIDVAMKQPLDKYLQNQNRKDMFVSECEKWMSLGVHPHIVQCYYVGEIDGKMSAFMEWMPHGTLKEAIKNGSIYCEDENERLLTLLDIALQIAIGLEYSHSKGVLHLDIKPENILIHDQTYKISDFGISNYLDSQNDKVFYTPLYCAPEQKEKGQLNETTDIYNYGVTLLHLLCGEVVWVDGVVVSNAHKKLLNNYSKINCPNELQEVLEKCLQRYQKDRYQSFESIIHKLIKCWNKYSTTPYEQHPNFYDNDSNSINNLGISYYNLNQKDKARDYWYQGYMKHPYFIPSHYNYQLYNYLYNQINFDAIYYVNNYQYDQKDSYHLYLLSRFYASTKAYERARKYASESISKALTSYKINIDSYLDNEKYIKQRYQENGPKVFFELNLKNILKVDSLEKDCLYLGMIQNNKLIYVSKTGKFTIIDLKNKKINHGNTNLNNIQYVTMSYNGRYIALCAIDENNSKENKVYHEIIVYDLKEEIIKIKMKFKGYYEKCKHMFFMNQSNEDPTLIVQFDHQLRDFSVINVDNHEICCENTKKLNYLLEGLNIHFTNIEELFGDYILGVSSGHCVLFDMYTNSELSKKFTYAFQTLKPNTMRFCPNSTHVFFINKNDGYSVYDALNEAFICEEIFDEKISHLTISPDGKTMSMIQNDNLVIRKIPDYTSKEKILWDMNSFRKMDNVMKDYKYAKDKEKEAYELLNQQPLNLNKIKENIKIVRNILEYENYLKLTALLSSKIGFNQVRTRKQFTNKDLEYYPINNGHLIKDLYIRKTNKSFESELYNSNINKKISCPYEDILGITKDTCYLVCKSSSNFNYMLIELEWIN